MVVATEPKGDRGLRLAPGSLSSSCQNEYERFYENVLGLGRWSLAFPQGSKRRGILVTSMRRLRSAFAFIDRYLTLAGKSCCGGQTQALRKSVARRTNESS